MSVKKGREIIPNILTIRTVTKFIGNTISSGEIIKLNMNSVNPANIIFFI